MADTLTTLRRQRARLKHDLATMVFEAALAHYNTLPSYDDLQETVYARLNELEALELAIASYDPQQTLFLDGAEGPR